MDRTREKFLILRDSIFDHPKINALREMMGWDDDKVLGFLARFWHRVQIDAPTGVFTGFVTPEVVLCSLRVNRKIRPSLLEAMLAVRLLDRDGNGTYSVHNWVQHGGKRENISEVRAGAGRKGGKASARQQRSKRQANDEQAPSNNEATAEQTEAEVRGNSKETTNSHTPREEQGENVGKTSEASSAAICEAAFGRTTARVLEIYRAARIAAGLTFAPGNRDRGVAASFALRLEAGEIEGSVAAGLEYFRVAVENLAGSTLWRNRYSLEKFIEHLSNWHDGGPKDEARRRTSGHGRNQAAVADRPDQIQVSRAMAARRRGTSVAEGGGSGTDPGTGNAEGGNPGEVWRA